MHSKSQTTEEWRSMDMPFYSGPQFWQYPQIEIRDDRTGETMVHETKDLHPAMKVYLKSWRPA